MDFSLNDEQSMMIDTIRRFITTELEPLENQVEEYCHRALLPRRANLSYL
jgi:hypothetical protein